MDFIEILRINSFKSFFKIFCFRGKIFKIKTSIKYQKETVLNGTNSNKFPNSPACPFLPTALPLTKTLIIVFLFFLCCYLSYPKHIIEEQTIKKVSTFFSNNLKLKFHSCIVSAMGKKKLLNPL